VDEGFDTMQLPGAPDVVAIPPWPGDNEAHEVPGAWPADGSA